METSKRHYCTNCNGKFYAKEMQSVYYKLLKKQAWHCNKCVSTSSDNLQFNLRDKNLYLVELFAGSKTVSKVANELNFKTFNVDIEDKFKPDLCIDINNLKTNQIPDNGKVFILWASIPCTQYSILSLAKHWDKITYTYRKYYYFPKTKEARSAIKLLEKTLYLIRKINPVYFFIENPRGALRHMPQISALPVCYTVSYLDYGLDIYKPTDIFTNCTFLKLKELRSSVGLNIPGSVMDLPDAFTRSIVPPILVNDIITQIKNHHNLI